MNIAKNWDWGLGQNKDRVIMTKKELEFILQEGEGLKIEFKVSCDKSLSKEIIAFTNASGGQIFLGIDDSGIVKGINITNRLKSQIQDIAKNCDPSIKVDSKIVEFDSQINKKFNFKNDFDETKFKEFLQLINIKSTIPLKNMLMNFGFSDGEFYNNACILFFAKNPSKHFLSSKVVCVNYQGNDKVNILDKKTFDNGIVENIREAINYVKKHIDVEYEIKSAERKEIPQYPEEAVREVIVNAVMHRDYFDVSGDIVVEVFKNKLFVSNPGGLVKSLKPEDFGTISRLRNPLIANILARTIYVEKLGTGISRIRTAIKESNLPEPEFDYNYSFFVTLLDKTYLKVPEKVTENQARILREITNNKSIISKDLSSSIGISERKIKENIKKLKQKGLLKRIGPDKGGHWKVI